MGGLLHIDLAEGSADVEDLDEGLTRLFLGGKGLGACLLYSMLEPRIDPLSPGNALLLLTGPLTGTLAPGSNRFCIVTKSPHTHTFLDSHCGGPFGPSMKYAGYDGLVIRNSAEEPSIAILDDNGFRLIPADGVWGMNAMESQRELDSMLGPGYQKVVIGHFDSAGFGMTVFTEFGRRRICDS